MLAPRGEPGIATLIFTHFWFKMFGTMGFTLVFFAAYLYLLKHPAFPVSVMPITWPDRLVDFQPVALPVYLSLWAYVSLPPVLMQTPREIVRYGWRIGSLCLAGLVVFYFWPNAVPPANIDWTRHSGVAFLKSVDTAGNACPSLHVATSMFSALWLHWRMREMGLSPLAMLLNIAWCIGIAYSTMAVKQHVAIDVLAGTLLGIGMAWLTGLKTHALNR
jgi:membrane-associated phospholipid phosphatase